MSKKKKTVWDILEVKEVWLDSPKVSDKKLRSVEISRHFITLSFNDDEFDYIYDVHKDEVPVIEGNVVRVTAEDPDDETVHLELHVFESVPVDIKEALK